MVFRNIRFFVLRGSSLDFREVRHFRSKMLGSGVLLALLLAAVVLVANHAANDVLGLGYDRVSRLMTENRILREQIRDFAQRVQGVQRTLDRLSARGDELRLAVDLRRIDDDTRSAAVGGATAASVNPFLSGEAAGIIAGAQSLIDRLAREVRLQQTSYEQITRRLEFNKGYFAHLPAIKPMAGPYSVNGYGMRIHPVLHVYRMHPGLDIIGDVGADVYAAGDGVVHFSGHTQGGYGIVVELDHGYGFSTLYAHLSRVLVRQGQAVRRGELIAKSGRSGLVSGPHLHYEVRRDGARQNPVDYFFDDVDAARYRTMLAGAGGEKGNHQQ